MINITFDAEMKELYPGGCDPDNIEDHQNLFRIGFIIYPIYMNLLLIYCMENR